MIKKKHSYKQNMFNFQTNVTAHITYTKKEKENPKSNL